MLKRFDIKDEKIISLYKSGLSSRKIGSKFNCSGNTILKRIRNAGEEIRKRSGPGEKSPRWKGGRHKTSQGYISVYCPGHPRASRNHVLEHIVIWEKIYNKNLPNGYDIHHLNGIRNDNRPENLIAIKHGTHAQLAEPYKKRIRELEIEIIKLKQLDLFRR